MGEGVPRGQAAAGGAGLGRVGQKAAAGERKRKEKGERERKEKEKEEEEIKDRERSSGSQAPIPHRRTRGTALWTRATAETHARTRYVAEEADGAGGVSACQAEQARGY